MGDKASATVEVLSASVQVLVVGSRQVTLSVYRQLDVVQREAMQPFGRVRDGQQSAALWLIGSHVETGALVRSQSHDNTGWIPAPDAYVHAIAHQVQRKRLAKDRCIIDVRRYDFDHPIGPPDAGNWVPRWQGFVPSAYCVVRDVLNTVERDDVGRVHLMGNGGLNRLQVPAEIEACDVSDAELTAAYRALAPESVAEVRRLHERFVKDKDRPLIVLAGLR